MLALRNLRRNRRRSVTTLISMVLGLTAVLLFGGYITDLIYGLQSDYVARTGHLQIQHKGYFVFGSGNPSAYGVRDYERIIASLKQDPVLAPMVAVITPTLQFGGIAGNFAAGVSRTIFASGIVVDDQNLMREWNEYGMRSLRHDVTLSGTAPNSAVLGTGVARVLQLCQELDVPNCPSPQPESSAPSGPELPDEIAALAQSSRTTDSVVQAQRGAQIEILAANVHGAPNVAGVNVVKAEFQGNKELDDVYVALHLTQAQTLIFGSEPPQVTAIAVQLTHTAQMQQARERVEHILNASATASPLEVIDYETLNPFYGQTLTMFATIFGFISVLIGAVVLFTISNTMSMVVIERTVEIGTIRAIGLRRRGIREVFMSEALLLGALGSVLGVSTALVIAWAINQIGLTWTPPGRIEAVPLAIRVSGEYLMMFGSAAGLIVVSTVSAILPATRASRMNIVDALRHV